jgi:xanthosine utilization system XapX-like protein
MKVIYKPIGVVLGLIGGLLGKRVFDAVWKRVDEEKPPKATTKETTIAKVVGAAAIQGVIFKVVRVVIDRAGASGWERLTGRWPGERRPKRGDEG